MYREEGKGEINRRRKETMNLEAKGGEIENIFTGKHFKGGFHRTAQWTGRGSIL
jgi:hypothetical protein